MNFIEVQEHQKKKTLSSLDRKQKICDTLAALFALIGYILEYSQYEKYYVQIVYTYLSPSNGFELRLKNENEATSLTVLRVFVLITTLLCSMPLSHLIPKSLVFMVYLRYNLDIQITIIKKNLSMPIQLDGQELVQRKNPIKKLVLRKYRWMILEFFVLFIHSLPKVNVNFSSSFQGTFLQYSLDMIIFIWTNTRIYLLVRIIRHYNKWMTEDAEAVCKTQGNFSITAFGLKALKKENPFLTIALLLVILMLIAGLSLRALERPYELVSGLNWDLFANALWCTFAIITTVGYGDFYPKTLAGRIMALIACFAGQFFVSLIITTITQNVEFSNPQNRAYHRIVTEFTATKLEKTTANVIKFGFRHFMDVKIRKTHKTYNNNYKKFMINLLEFKALRKSIAIEEANLSFGFYIERFKEDVNNKKYEVIKAVRKLDNLSLRMKTLEENYQTIDKAVSSLHQYNSNILSAFEQIEERASKRQTFDKIHNNLYALEKIDELETINRPLELIARPAETPKLKKITSSPSPSPYLSPRKSASSTLLDEKKKERLMKRIQKAQEKVDSELMNMLDDQSLPAMSLKHKRALSKNETAKDLLGTILVIKKKFVDKRKKTAYISGNTLAKTILELNEEGAAAKSPVALLSTLHPSGPIKTEGDDDDDDGKNSRPSLTEAGPAIQVRTRAKSQIEPNDVDIKGKLRERWQRAKSIALIPKKFFNVLPVQEEETNKDLKGEPQLVYERTTEIKYHTKGTLVIRLTGDMNSYKKPVFRSQIAKPQALPMKNLTSKFSMDNINHQKQAIRDTSFEDEPAEKPTRRSILANSPEKQLSPQKRGSNLSVKSDKKSRQLTWKNVQEEHLHSNEDESSPNSMKEDSVPTPVRHKQTPNSPMKQRARLASIDPSYIPTHRDGAPKQQDIDSSLSLTDIKKELEKVTPTLTEAGVTARQPVKSHYIGDLFQQDSRKTSLLETKPSTNRTSQPLQNNSLLKQREFVFKKHHNIDSDDEDDVTNDPSVLDFKAALDNIDDKNSVTHTQSIYRRESDLRKNILSNPLTRMGSVLTTLNGLDKNLDSDREISFNNNLSRMRTFDHYHENRRTESLFKMNRHASQENDAIDNMLKNLNFTDSNFRVPTDINPKNNVSNHNFFELIDRDLEPAGNYAPKNELDPWDVDLVDKIKSEDMNQRNKRNLLYHLKK